VFLAFVAAFGNSHGEIRCRIENYCRFSPRSLALEPRFLQGFAEFFADAAVYSPGPSWIPVGEPNKRVRRIDLSSISWIPLGLTLSVAVAGGANAQDTPAEGATAKTIRAVRVETPPVIDGVLDEAVWAQAEPISDFVQVRPTDGGEPSETTEVYLLYDDDALYVGARLGDSDPDQIAANTMRHGVGLGRTDDRLVLILDPFNTRRGGYRFETNANGVRHDMLYQNVSQIQTAWDTIWETAGSIDENGWLTEIAIPFKSLAFDPDAEAWGFNFARSIRRRGEEIAWVTRNRSYNPSISGLATGFEGLDQGIGLDIVPSISVVEQKFYDPGDSQSETNPSLDVYYRLTPSLNGSLTFNTDFSATEVDSRQVNLTRFNLFFPERRDFFLNDADLFNFARIGGGGFGGVFNRAQARSDRESSQPFFSRRIGLDADGAPVDLKYGGKISGRVGRWNIGTLAIRQDGFQDFDDAGAFVENIDETDIFVGRLSANVLEESALGFIVTEGDPRSNLDNSVFGIDFRYLNTRLPGGRQLEGDAWFQRSTTPGLSGNDTARGLRLRSPNNQGLRGGFGVNEVEENFNPALGFVNRAGIRDMVADIGYTHYFDSERWQRVMFRLDAQRVTLLDGGGLDSQTIRARLFEVRAHSFDAFEYEFIAQKEVVVDAFTLYEDYAREVGVMPGEYSFGEHVFAFETGRHRPFFVEIDFQWGDFFGGKRDRTTGALTWRPSSRFSTTLEYDWNDIQLPDGHFISRLLGWTTEFAFSSTLFWVNLIQYDNDSEEIGINSRLQWIPRSGQEGFIVLNHNLQDFDKNNKFNSQRADLSLKFNYTFRF